LRLNVELFCCVWDLFLISSARWMTASTYDAVLSTESLLMDLFALLELEAGVAVAGAREARCCRRVRISVSCSLMRRYALANMASLSFCAACAIRVTAAADSACAPLASNASLCLFRRPSTTPSNSAFFRLSLDSCCLSEASSDERRAKERVSGEPGRV